jgi:hypothetical protein
VVLLSTTVGLSSGTGGGSLVAAQPAAHFRQRCCPRAEAKINSCVRHLTYLDVGLALMAIEEARGRR